MPNIGVTGHMNIAKDSEPLILRALTAALIPFSADSLVGISCIAEGADTLFAEAVLELGGALHVVLPAADYRERRVRPDHAPRFDELIRRATDVDVLPHPTSNRDAYAAANEAVLARSDMLMAVWDGQSPVDHSGTGAVVQQARTRGLPVTVIWPDGAHRE
jgi:hypothetical protein